MAPLVNIKLYAPPPSTADVGLAYVRLALGLGQRKPGLIQSYLGRAEWLAEVQAEPPSQDTLRTHAVAVATAVQKSDLARNRRERLLRNVRALLWLMRADAGEQIIFSEQVRLLLDLSPESAGEELFQTAHDTLSALLPGSGSLANRWAAWQDRYTRPADELLPLLDSAFNVWRDCLGWSEDLVSLPLQVIETRGKDAITYAQGTLRVPCSAPLRVDRLYHLAAEWGYGGAHSIHSSLAQRYAAGEGEIEAAIRLSLGPDQVLAQGLPQALLQQADLYSTTIPALLEMAGLPVWPVEQLQAIHLAEDMLRWSLGNAALLLHGEGLRPRAVRRYLAANGLMPVEMADSWLAYLADPVQAAHVFAPLVSGPLVGRWLALTGQPVFVLLNDPPVPSTMLFEVRLAAEG